MEIVSKPDLRSPEEVNLYIKIKINNEISRYVMEHAKALRADVNVSVRKLEVINWVQDVKLKMLIRLSLCKWRLNMKQIDRQNLEEGNVVDQETRLFDTKNQPGL